MCKSTTDACNTIFADKTAGAIDTIEAANNTMGANNTTRANSTTDEMVVTFGYIAMVENVLKIKRHPRLEIYYMWE